MGSLGKMMKEVGHHEEKVPGGRAAKVWDCGSPLYDSFELVSVSHVLDRNLMVLPFSGDGSGAAGRWTSETANAKKEVVTRWGADMRKKCRGVLRMVLFMNCVKSRDKLVNIKTRLHGGCRSLAFWKR